MIASDMSCSYSMLGDADGLTDHGIAVGGEAQRTCASHALSTETVDWYPSELRVCESKA